MAGGRDGFASDAVNLVEGMWSQEAVVCGPYEQLQGERLAFHVAIKLAGEQRHPGERQHQVLRPPFQATPHLGNTDWMHGLNRLLIVKEALNDSSVMVEKLQK